MNVLLGVTGSISAYKAAELVRILVGRGDSVSVAMTPAACKFVSPLTFMTLSRNPVHVDMFPETKEWKPVHIALAESADVAVVAPASANTIAKMRFGMADNALLGALLATRAPIVIAPAMNAGMWENAATKENVAALAARGVRIVAPGTGELACGAQGAGRMASPEEIAAAIASAARLT